MGAEEVGGASAARELRCSVCLPFVAVYASQRVEHHPRPRLHTSYI